MYYRLQTDERGARQNMDEPHQTDEGRQHDLRRANIKGTGTKRGRGSFAARLFGHSDWLPTFLAAAGEPDIGAKLLKGHKAGDKTYKVHLDGYDQTVGLGETDRARERSSTTSPTMATMTRSATTNGRSHF